MKLYILTSKKPSKDWEDRYDGFLIAADSAEEAIDISMEATDEDNWTTKDNIEVREIGEAIPSIEKGIVFESYQAVS